VSAAIDGRREEDVRRALAATRRERPVDPFTYFVACQVVAPLSAPSVAEAAQSQKDLREESPFCGAEQRGGSRPALNEDVTLQCPEASP
jgi:hypothetical protein